MENPTIKFLIIRFSSIGDIVLTTPVIRMIKNQIENAEIHYLTKPQYFPVLQANPYITRLHALQDDFKSMIEELKQEEFLYVVDLHHNIRSENVKRQLRLPAFTVNKLNWEKWLRVWLKIDRLPKVHIVDRYLNTLQVFDVENDQQGLDYFIPESDQIPADNLPFKDYALMVIGGQHETKKMPVEILAELCSLLPFPVILAGGPEDALNADKIIQLSKNKSLFNACGKYSINQSASLVQQSRLVISHDTGLMHVAAAFHKKIISIWGNTIPDFGMYPYFADKESVQFERKDLSCRPCSKIGYSKCPKKHFKCMLEQDIEGIAEAAKRLW